MPALALALALATATPAAGAETRAAAALDLYRQFCFDPADFGKLQARVEAGGWQPFAPEPETPVGRYADHRGRGFHNVLHHRVYRRTADGSPVYLFLMEAKERSGIGSGVHCTLFDPAVTRLPTLQQVTAWAGTAPTSPLTGAKGWAWWPGIAKGMEQTNVELIDGESIFREEGPGFRIWSIDNPGASE